MTNSIIAELSSDTYCSALNFTVRSPSPVLALCRKLIESGTYGSSAPLDAYRGDTLCLRVRSIGGAAELRTGVTPTGTPTFRPRQTMPGGPTIESESE
jgi:hypothetical protein